MTAALAERPQTVTTATGGNGNKPPGPPVRFPAASDEYYERGR